MASSYPSGLDSLTTTHADAVNEIIHASDIDNLADAVNKIEAELGLLPKGSFASVRARLDAIVSLGTNPQGVYADVATRLAALEFAPVNTRTANYTLVLADASKLVEMNVAGANTLTVPPNSSVAFTVGTAIQILQYGAGLTTVTQGAGVTIQSRGSAFRTAGQYAAATLWKRATDEWILTGDVQV